MRISLVSRFLFLHPIILTRYSADDYGSEDAEFEVESNDQVEVKAPSPLPVRPLKRQRLRTPEFSNENVIVIQRKSSLN